MKRFVIASCIFASGCGSTAGFTATAAEPMQPGYHTALSTPDTRYTTCPMSDCPGTSAVGWTFTYEGDAYTVTNSAGDTASVPVSNGQLRWDITPASYINNAGCQVTRLTSVLLTLAAQSFTGAAQMKLSAQACNGYAAQTCVCAYDIASQ